MAYIYSWEVGYSDHSSIAGGEATMEGAKAKIIENIIYYNDLGYKIRDIKLDMECVACHGNGRVAVPGKTKRFIHETKICPDCKGKIATIKLL